MKENILKGVVIAGMAGFLAFMGYMIRLTARVEAATGPVIEDFYAKYAAQDFQSIADRRFTEPLRSLFSASGQCPSKVRRSFKLKDLTGKRIYYRFDVSCDKGGRTDVFILADQGGMRYALESFPGSEPACTETR